MPDLPLDPISDKPDISFAIEQVDYEINNQEHVAAWLIAVAREKLRTISFLEFVFCSDAYILKVNREHLDHDYYTDIITFPLQQSPLEATIFISVDRVRENAELYNSSTRDELHRVMAHGLLHLLGYNDNTEDEKSEMRHQENECLLKRDFI